MPPEITPTPDASSGVDTAATPAAQPTPTPAPQPAPAQSAPDQPAAPAIAPASAAGPTPGVHGIMGSMVIGALKGAAQHIAKGVGRELATVARNSPYGQELQKNALERQEAQQRMGLAQKAEQRAEQKSKEESVAATDAHQEAVLRTNKMSLDNIHQVAENAHLEAMYPGLEDEQRNTLLVQHQAQDKAQIELLSELEAAGVHLDISHGAGHEGLTPDHAKDVASGKVTMLSNGQTGDKAGYAFVDNTSLQNTPLTKDTKVISDWTLDPKTGVISPVYSTLTAGNNTAFDALITHGAAMEKFQQLQTQYKQQSEAAKEKAGIAKDESEAEKNRAEAAKATAEASALGGEVVQDMAARLVDADMDPSQLPKRAANYDSTLKAADDYSMQKYGKHFDIAQASSDYKYATQTQTQNTLKYLNSVIPNMANLVRQSDAIKRTQLPALNDAAAWARIQAGDPAMAAYFGTVTEVSDQIAKILQGGGTGSGTSDAKLKQAQDLFAKGFNPAQIKAVSSVLTDLLNERRKDMIGDNRYLLKQYGQSPVSGGGQAGGGPRTVSVGGTTYNLDPDGTFKVNGYTYKPTPDGKSATLVK